MGRETLSYARGWSLFVDPVFSLLSFGSRVRFAKNNSSCVGSQINREDPSRDDIDEFDWSEAGDFVF